jgi:nitrite reductase/ring-hydroxylating ferredoxin subunit
MSAHHEGPHDCAGQLDRRRFLQQASALAVGILASLGGASPALAQAVREIDALDNGTIDNHAADGRVVGAVIRQYPLPSADGAYIDPINEVLIVRWAAHVYAFALACPHRGATLEWQSASHTVICPKHKARFQPDGAHTGGRATRDLDRFGVRVDGGKLTVDLGARLRADTQTVAWREAVVAVGAG